MNDMMKIVQALEDSNILLKGVTETIKNETKEQKRVSLGILLSTLGAGLWGSTLTGEAIVRAVRLWKQRRKRNGNSCLWK